MVSVRLSRQRPPQRMQGRSKAWAFCEKGVRYIAGTGRTIGRERPPAGHRLLPCATAWSPATLAQRQPSDDVHLIATTGWPWPPGSQRYARQTPPRPPLRQCVIPPTGFSPLKLPLSRGHQRLSMLPYTTLCSVPSYMRRSDGQQSTGQREDCQCPPTR